MSFLPRLKGLAAAVGLTLALPTLAADHPLTANTFDSQAGVNVLDMVLSVDWNLDNPPEGFSREFVNAVLQHASRSLYTMTEGKLMLGKVHVYGDSQFMDNTDLMLLQERGRASAHISGFNNGCRTCRARQFAFSGDPALIGKTVAHELGHYALGVYDEYREMGRAASEWPSQPIESDIPRNTIMNNHREFALLSTATDYANPDERRTAQYRMFGKSAWETLVQDPAADNTGMSRQRIRFESMRDMAAPTQLTAPTSGWESRLNVVFMGSGTAKSGDRAAAISGPLQALVIDQGVSAQELEAVTAAARNAVDEAGSGSRLAVVAYPYTQTGGLGLTVADAAGKVALKQAIGAIKASGTDDEKVRADWVFDAATLVYPELFAPAGGTSAEAYGYYHRYYPATHKYLGVKEGRVYFYDPASGGLETAVDVGTLDALLPQAQQSASQALQKALGIIGTVRQESDTPAITLFGGSGTALDTSVVNQAGSQRVAINGLSLNVATAQRTRSDRFSVVKAGEQMGLPDATAATNGIFDQASHSAEVAGAAARLVHASAGDTVQTVAESYVESLTAGTSVSSSVVISAIDGAVEFNAYWGPSDDGRVGFSLTAPDGTAITPENLPGGVTYSMDADEGIASYRIAKEFAQRAGTWTTTVTALQSTAEGLLQEVTTVSALGVGVDATAGSLVAAVEGIMPVIGATVVADVYDAAGRRVAANIPLLDNGVGADEQKDDGYYSVATSGIPAGDYEVQVRVSNPNGTAAYSTKGSLEQGTDEPDQALPPFQRFETDTVSRH